MRQTAFEGGDCTAPYAVELDKEYTVQEFVTAVLSKSKEWGYIGIEHKLATFGEPHCEYRYGQLLSELPPETLCKKVISARAHGGYTRMDYYLSVDS
uniref:hypothetical protein n=1 Tax=Alistipes sp. TaxID=1872444 RepID=UPI004056BC1B